jgi:GGDEF domain-containing protein
VSGSREDIEKRIEAAVAALDNRSDPVPVTASVGVAVVDSSSVLWHAGKGIVSRMMRTADAMMYRAKTDGGNRVLCKAL